MRLYEGKRRCHPGTQTNDPTLPVRRKHAKQTKDDIIQSKSPPNQPPIHSNGRSLPAPRSARTPIPIVLDVDVDGILEVPAELFRLLLKQRVPCDD